MSELAVALPAALEAHRGAAPVAVVLGSGFGGLADLVSSPSTYAYGDLEGHPEPQAGVVGHAGRLLIGDVQGTGVAVFDGRYHLYQGLSALDAAWTARLAAALGCTTIVLTNAAGAVSDQLTVGDVVLVEDHVNLTGQNPLVGWPGPEGGAPFVPMRDVYDEELRGIAMTVAGDEGIYLHSGTYFGLLGPSYETTAEVAMLRSLGADVVGMSTVIEAIAARALGLRVLGLSLVTNSAAQGDLSHEEVLEAGREAQGRLSGLMAALLQRMR